MTVWAEIEGHPFDLDALARHFPNGDPRVITKDGGTFLVTDHLDDVFTDAGRIIEIASDDLARLNGWAILTDAEYRPVRLRNNFHREAGPIGPTHQHVMTSDEARVRDSVTAVVVGTAEVRGTTLGVATVVTDRVAVKQQPPPTGPRHLARGDKDIDDLLSLVGKAEKLSWSQLYKVFEIICEAVGGGRAGVIATGWTVNADLNAFTGSANHDLVSGIHEGRHARHTGGPPKRTMTLDEAQTYIRRLARDWLGSLLP